MRDPLDDLCGERVLEYVSTDVRHPFSADANGIAFGFRDLTVIFFEDPSDGYRSGHFAPLITLTPLHALMNSDVTPVADVPVIIQRWTRSERGCANGIALIDKRNGRVIALAGTDAADDYYPCFVGTWAPQNLASNGAEAAPGGGFYAV